MDEASHNGHVGVLDWWINSGLEVDLTGFVMDRVSVSTVLDWWAKSGLELRWTQSTQWAINSASRNGHLSVL
ncbi:hypothetical protein BJ742DRAFT_831292, partial [Cladochytrium replicatum]